MSIKTFKKDWFYFCKLAKEKKKIVHEVIKKNKFSF